MNCLTSCVKWIVYILNVIFVICGILLIVLGSLMIGNMGDFTNFDQVINTETIPILIIILGCIIFIVAFFGCCGTSRESVCCTSIYAICMFILFVLQLALVIWIFVQRDKFLERIGEAVDTAWNQNDSANGFPMDALQLSMKCCGKVSFLDWGGSVPASCCGFVDRNAVCPAATYQTRPGCRAEFIQWWDTNMDIIRFGGIGLAIIEFAVFLIAVCLACSMRNGRNSHNL